MFCSFYLILYIIWFQFSLSLSPFYYFDYYEHQYFTSVLFHMFSFIKNALFGSYSWMSHRTFIESSAVTTAFWQDQYGGRFASRAHHTKSLRILCNVYSSGIKTHEFCAFWGSSAEFCLLSSVKLWFKEKLEASTTQWTAKKFEILISRKSRPSV